MTGGLPIHSYVYEWFYGRYLVNDSKPSVALENPVTLADPMRTLTLPGFRGVGAFHQRVDGGAYMSLRGTTVQSPVVGGAFQ